MSTNVEKEDKDKADNIQSIIRVLIAYINPAGYEYLEKQEKMERRNMAFAANQLGVPTDSIVLEDGYEKDLQKLNLPPDVIKEILKNGRK